MTLKCVSVHVAILRMGGQMWLAIELLTLQATCFEGLVPFGLSQTSTGLHAQVLAYGIWRKCIQQVLRVAAGADAEAAAGAAGL